MEQTLTISQNSVKSFLIVVGASILLALSARVIIPLPFTPVPIAITASLALFLSAFFGKRGAYATFAYLAQGVIGLPVFSRGGSGIAYLLGPTGGYLMGLAIAAFVVAIFSERLNEKSPSKIFGLLLVGNMILFIFGVPHLALFVGWQNSLSCGFFPFIAGGLFKLIVAQRALKAFKFFR